MWLSARRELADGPGISCNTVMNAYSRLRAEGYLEGRVGSGTYTSHALLTSCCAPAGSTESGMSCALSPRLVNETTTLSLGSIPRETMCRNPVTACAATVTGPTAGWDQAACPPSLHHDLERIRRGQRRAVGHARLARLEPCYEVKPYNRFDAFHDPASTGSSAPPGWSSSVYRKTKRTSPMWLDQARTAVSFFVLSAGEAWFRAPGLGG